MSLQPLDLVTAMGVCGTWRVDRVIGDYARLTRVDAVSRDCALFVSRLRKVAA